MYLTQQKVILLVQKLLTFPEFLQVKLSLTEDMHAETVFV